MRERIPGTGGYDLTDVPRPVPGLSVTDEMIRPFEKTVQRVYIDERPVKFSGQTLMQYLRSLGSRISAP